MFYEHFKGGRKQRASLLFTATEAVQKLCIKRRHCSQHAATVNKTNTSRETGLEAPWYSPQTTFSDSNEKLQWKEVREKDTVINLVCVINFYRHRLPLETYTDLTSISLLMLSLISRYLATVYLLSPPLSLCNIAFMDPACQTSSVVYDRNNYRPGISTRPTFVRHSCFTLSGHFNLSSLPRYWVDIFASWRLLSFGEVSFQFIYFPVATFFTTNESVLRQKK